MSRLEYFKKFLQAEFLFNGFPWNFIEIRNQYIDGDLFKYEIVVDYPITELQRKEFLKSQASLLFMPETLFNMIEPLTTKIDAASAIHKKEKPSEFEAGDTNNNSDFSASSMEIQSIDEAAESATNFEYNTEDDYDPENTGSYTYIVTISPSDAPPALSTGAIIGIAVGCVSFVILAVGVAVYSRSRVATYERVGEDKGVPTY